MEFTERLKKGIVIFDGAMGTQIHLLKPSDKDYLNKTGCSEILNLTIPDKVQRIHESYLAAGADVVETNTFGANEIVLSEYNIADRVEEINIRAAEIAKEAARKFSDTKPRFIAGSIGPGTKLASLGHTTYDRLYESYFRQAKALIHGGIDLFIVETCQDPLQIKACINAVRDANNLSDTDLPIIVSVTIETTGALLIGTELSAISAIISPFNIDALGINCAMGPDTMGPYVRELSKNFKGPILVMPNAGLPQNINGEVVYSLSREEFVKWLVSFVKEDGVQIVGGCCGTDPSYIEELSKNLRGINPGKRTIEIKPAIASIYSSVSLSQDPAPLFLGERTNTNGSKKFREFLLNNDFEGMLSVALEQEKSGAHALDLCVAYTGRNEISDMREAVSRFTGRLKIPLVIDTTDTNVMEDALKNYGGRAIINSINLEDGEERAHRICKIAKKFGAAIIALTIDEKGMAHEVDRKLEIARRIHDIAVNKNNLNPSDLVFDPLTFTLGSGDESLKNAGINTLNGIKEIKKEFSESFTLLGLSNISFGLKAHSREILNSVFLSEAIKAGLDIAIVNIKNIIPIHSIDKEDMETALNLIYNRGENPLLKFIEYFDKKEGISPAQKEEFESLDLNTQIKNKIISGNPSNLENLLHQKLKEDRAVNIINNILIPAMKVVGDLFGSGKMQLPFVLQSAETMKFAVDKLTPFMEKTGEESVMKIVLATVRGDVHDIGKNLVNIILTNNGFKVYDLGIKCEIDAMIKKAEEIKAGAIGMSGLLVKSTVVMKENIEEMKKRNVNIPVLLGGAALNKKYVDEVCAPILDSPVVYCHDAFAGLLAMNQIKDGTLKKEAANIVRQEVLTDFKTAKIETIEKLSFSHTIPKPPFLGSRVVTDIDIDEVYTYLTEEVIFRGRWGYRRLNLSKEDYERLISDEVRPEFVRLKEKCKREKLFEPKVVYGYYHCNSIGDSIIIYEKDLDRVLLKFDFPRQRKAPFRSIPDFIFGKDTDKKDIIAFQIATIGDRAIRESKRLYEENHYRDYLLLHGLSVEVTEALAEMWHRKVREELNISASDGSGISDFIVQKYRGSRYSFGYPSCPSLEENAKVITLLQAERIGVSLTDNYQMVPETTTSAFIIHHPQAKYFTPTP